MKDELLNERNKQIFINDLDNISSDFILFHESNFII